MLRSSNFVCQRKQKGGSDERVDYRRCPGDFVRLGGGLCLCVVYSREGDSASGRGSWGGCIGYAFHEHGCSCAWRWISFPLDY
ncbi:hypothetical protein HQ544_01825 [Candidatus Falkowbacteria bacterium]|nr:hypothetical protein [Candidatus Falkowbacteria bacterium]